MAAKKKGWQWYSQMRDLLSQQLRNIEPGTDAQGRELYLYVKDFTDSEVVYSYMDKSWQRTYTVDAQGSITFGAAEQVVEQSEWVTIKPASFSQFTVEAQTEDEIVLFGKVFDLNVSYDDKGGFRLSSEEADAEIARFNAGDGVDNNLEHIRVGSKPLTKFVGHKLGKLEKLARNGDELFARFRMPAWLARLGDAKWGSGVLQTSLEFNSEKQIIGNALTMNPRVSEAQAVAVFTSGFGMSLETGMDQNNPNIRGEIESGLMAGLRRFFGQGASKDEPEAPATDGKAIPTQKFSEVELRMARVARKQAAETFFSDLLSSGRVVPAQREQFVTAFSHVLDADANSASVLFDESTDAVFEGPGAKAFREFVQSLQPNIVFSGSAEVLQHSAPEIDMARVDRISGVKK